MIKSINLLLRQDVLEFIKYYRTSFPQIAYLYFCIYKPHPGTAGQFVTTGKEVPSLFVEPRWQFEKDLIRDVQDINKHENRITTLLRHDPKKTRLFCVEANDLERWLNDKQKNIKDDEAIGWVSLCKNVDDSFNYIPMMDFSCDISSQNQVFIKKAMHHIGEKKGIFLNSGNSYHYYGYSRIPPLKWHHFMSRCILLGPFADVRYIAHGLLSGYCILRISGSKLKQEISKIIDYIDY